MFRGRRTGRLADTQEFEHLAFERARFTPDCLAELRARAGNSVRLEGDRVVISHLYIEAKMTPLNLYLARADPEAATRALLDYGDAIKELATNNIFAGDLLWKNFGVTQNGRLVLYDYDEICPLLDCKFRRIPPARTLGGRAVRPALLCGRRRRRVPPGVGAVHRTARARRGSRAVHGAARRPVRPPVLAAQAGRGGGRRAAHRSALSISLRVPLDFSAGPMRRQLRAIEGPLAGAVYVVRGRTRLGRAGDSDIQILHDGVSRQHAQVIEDNAGNAVLMDLASNNGTFIKDKRIVRHRLAHGDEIRIMRARFLFEEVEDDPDVEASSSVFAVKVNSAETHRRTVDHWQLDLPAPRSSDGRTRDSSPSIAEPGGERHRVVACYADGSTYDGDILGDILEYRALRLRSLRGDALTDDELRRYGTLQGAFTSSPATARSAIDAATLLSLSLHVPRASPTRCALRRPHGPRERRRHRRGRCSGFGAPGDPERGRAGLAGDRSRRRRPPSHDRADRPCRQPSQDDRYGLLFAGAPEWEQWHPA